jgi:hypothetical protein
MKTTIVICAFALLLSVTGCLFGDRVAPPRTVSLRFPAPSGQPSGLSASDTQVQDALRVIDTVLTADGRTRDPNPPAANEPGLVASYAKNNGTGPRPVDNPNVYLRGDRLEVVFTEFWNRSGHLSAATKKVCDSLQKELSSHYGADRVKVE